MVTKWPTRCSLLTPLNNSNLLRNRILRAGHLPSPGKAGSRSSSLATPSEKVRKGANITIVSCLLTILTQRTTSFQPDHITLAAGSGFSQGPTPMDYLKSVRAITSLSCPMQTSVMKSTLSWLNLWNSLNPKGWWTNARILKESVELIMTILWKTDMGSLLSALGISSLSVSVQVRHQWATKAILESALRRLVVKAGHSCGNYSTDLTVIKSSSRLCSSNQPMVSSFKSSRSRLRTSSSQWEIITLWTSSSPNTRMRCLLRRWPLWTLAAYNCHLDLRSRALSRQQYPLESPHPTVTSARCRHASPRSCLQRWMMDHTATMWSWDWDLSPAIPPTKTSWQTMNSHRVSSSNSSKNEQV